MISGKLVRAKARILGVATAALALSMIALPAKAQPYPSRSITILVGYSAGGQADALARIVGKQLGENLKVSVVIENKTGANGMIAAQAAARAEPDGYTILMVTDAMVTIDPHLATSNHFDLSKAMEPVVNVAWAPLLLAAANNVPANSVAELVALGKQKTQNLSFGSSGSSTPHRLAGEMLQKYGGFTMTHIPYKGTAASVNDLLGGQIPLLFGAPTAVEPLATAGKIKATVNKEVNQILATDSMRAWLDKQGMVAVGGTPEDFGRQIEVDYQARGELVRALGITGE